MKTDVVLYEIWWQYKQYDLPLKEYVGYGEFTTLWRHQVISIHKEILEQTIERLKIVSPTDYSFEIREVK